MEPSPPRHALDAVQDAQIDDELMRVSVNTAAQRPQFHVEMPVQIALEVPQKHGTKPKRSHVTKSLEIKTKALGMMDAGMSGKAVARLLGVGCATVIDWKKNRQKIEAQFRAAAENPARRTCKPSHWPELDQALLEWHTEQSARRKVCDSEIQQTAISLFNNIYTDDPTRAGAGFKASEGWLYRWKIRHGVIRKPRQRKFVADPKSDVLTRLLDQHKPHDGSLPHAIEIAGETIDAALAHAGASQPLPEILPPSNLAEILPDGRRSPLPPTQSSKVYGVQVNVPSAVETHFLRTRLGSHEHN